jgi:hypothetical protein
MQEVGGSIGRTGWSIGSLLLAGVASVALSAPAAATLTIDPTFGAGVTSSAQAAFNYAAGEYETLFNQHNNITININVGTMSSGLGESMTPLAGTFTYSQVRSDLINEYAAAPSAARTTASGLGGSINTTTDPTSGGSFWIPTTQEKALGLLAGNNAASDGTFLYNSTLSYTFNPANRMVPGEFDFIGVAEHEISEIMGRIPGLGTTIGGVSNGYLPYDLFRYTGTNTRGITNTGAGNYFSLDNGVTDLQGYNNAAMNGGDPQDWNGANPTDPYNAGTSAGQGHMISGVDITAMNVLGYDLATVPAPLIGHGLTVFLGFGVVLFGAKLLERSKKKGVDRLEPQGWLSLGA